MKRHFDKEDILYGYQINMKIRSTSLIIRETETEIKNEVLLPTH